MSDVEQQEDSSASREWEGKEEHEHHEEDQMAAHEEEEELELEVEVGGEIECSESGSNFQTKNDVVEHVLRECDIGRFVCQECGQQFGDESSLTRHTLIHSDINTNEKFCECQKCGKILTWESDITKHIHIHTGEVTFNPNMSYASETTPDGMDEEQQSQEHQENMFRDMENTEEMEVDRVEGQETSGSGEWQEAEADQGSHASQESHFECSDCGKVFDMSTSSLGWCGPNPFGVMTFKCKECAQDDEYNVGDYECQECGKKFVQKSSLTTHMLIHSGVRNYACQECGKKFLQKRHMLQHVSTHRDEKNYECKLCNETFGLRTSYETHIRSHVELKMFECAHCGKKFTRKPYLRLHLKKCSVAEKENGASHCNSGEGEGEGAVKPAAEVSHELVSSVKKEAEEQESHPDAGNSAQEEEEGKEGEEEEEEMLQCPGCRSTFQTKAELVEHTLRQCDIGNFECQLCSKKFTHKSNLTRHMQIHTGVKNHECPECGKKFFQKGNLKQHMLTHRGDCNYECMECGKNFFLLSSLVRHCHFHNISNDEYQESEVFVTTDRTQVATSDVNKEDESDAIAETDAVVVSADVDNSASSSEIPVKSGAAGSDYVRGKENHIVTDISDEQEVGFKCSDCGEHFQTKSKLDAHTLRHSSARVFECEVCNKVFTYKSNLTRHLLIHSGIKNYECERCGKRFTQKGNLLQHMITHRGDKNYVCQRCGEKFYLKCSLSLHVCSLATVGVDGYQQSEKLHSSLPHQDNLGVNSSSQSKQVGNSNVAAYIIVDPERLASGELQEQPSNNSRSAGEPLTHFIASNAAYRDDKRYECTECGKRFTFRSNLTRHSMIHSGVKNHECIHCGKRFNQKGNLNQHMLTHRNDKNYVCQGCGERFHLKCALNKHVCTFHTA